MKRYYASRVGQTDLPRHLMKLFPSMPSRYELPVRPPPPPPPTPPGAFHLLSQPRTARREQHIERSPVEFTAEPIPALAEIGNDRIKHAEQYFETEDRLYKELQWTNKKFDFLGSFFQNQMLSSIADIDRKTKLIFLFIVKSTVYGNGMTFTIPLRLLSYLVGIPDELYDETTFLSKAVTGLGDESRDWARLSLADLFDTRSELVKGIQFKSPWNSSECVEVIFDIDLERTKERNRPRYVFVTSHLAQQLLWRHVPELRRLYATVYQQLLANLPIFERYSSSTGLAVQSVSCDQLSEIYC